MCVVCYLSTDRDIADIPFDEHAPTFNLQKTDERPLPCLTKRFVYHCGANTGCGCAFGKLGGITEEILQQTERDFLKGALRKKTSMMWWNVMEPPPKNREAFYEQAKEIRMSRRDTLALYDLIADTWRNGYACEVLVFWYGDEQKFPVQVHDFDLHHAPIAIDFDTFHINTSDQVRLYRFPIGCDSD